MGESAIEAKVVKWAKANGWLAWKLTSPGTVGVPDRLFIAPNGVMAFIEFKAEGREPRPVQRLMLRELNRRNVLATWFDNVEEAIRFLQLEESMQQLEDLTIE